MAYNPDTMSFEEPNTDMVYVSGLPSSTTEEDIAAHFGSIGLLKEDKKKNKPKIWLYRDKGTNQLKVLVFPASLLSQCHQALNLQAFRLLLLNWPRRGSWFLSAPHADTSAMQGDGTVTYQDPFSAASAVQWFNGKEFKGDMHGSITCLDVMLKAMMVASCCPNRAVIRLLVMVSVF